MEEQKISSDLIRGHIDTFILKQLVTGDKYGYEIGKLISSATKGDFELKEATMYSSFKRMEKDKFITSYWGDETQGARRKYYRITTEGKLKYNKNKKDWEFIKQLFNKLI